jgi:hypothetical protein
LFPIKRQWLSSGSLGGKNVSTLNGFVKDYGVESSTINERRKQVAKLKKLQAKYYKTGMTTDGLAYYRHLNLYGYHEELLSN